jgi:hypothetical protein
MINRLSIGGDVTFVRNVAVSKGLITIFRSDFVYAWLSRTSGLRSRPTSPLDFVESPLSNIGSGSSLLFCVRMKSVAACLLLLALPTVLGQGLGKTSHAACMHINCQPFRPAPTTKILVHPRYLKLLRVAHRCAPVPVPTGRCLRATAIACDAMCLRK